MKRQGGYRVDHLDRLHHAQLLVISRCFIVDGLRGHHTTLQHGSGGYPTLRSRLGCCLVGSLLEATLPWARPILDQVFLISHPLFVALLHLWAKWCC